MGITIEATKPLGHVPPIPVQVQLECDAVEEFFCRGFEVFTSDDGYIGAHHLAMTAGWLERNGPQGRVWLCPVCSGKGKS